MSEYVSMIKFQRIVQMLLRVFLCMSELRGSSEQRRYSWHSLEQWQIMHIQCFKAREQTWRRLASAVPRCGQRAVSNNGLAFQLSRQIHSLCQYQKSGTILGLFQTSKVPKRQLQSGTPLSRSGST